MTKEQADALQKVAADFDEAFDPLKEASAKAQAAVGKADAGYRQAREALDAANMELSRLNSADPDQDPGKSAREIRRYIDGQDKVRRERAALGLNPRSRGRR